MYLALKVDVDTLRGTLQGVPALLRLFDRYQVQASFFFTLGPEQTGRAIRWLLRPQFFSKVRRTSVLHHYGLATLLRGTVLPTLDIGRRGAQVMRSVAAAGHEVGIHCYHHVDWQHYAATSSADWTRYQLTLAREAFLRIFQQPAHTHAAAGWQVNTHLLHLEQQLDFHYASDTRGRSPFFPAWNNVHTGCMQLPTTLSTLDELLGRDGFDTSTVHEQLFAQSQALTPFGHVFTLHAELEGLRLIAILERLLIMWQSHGDHVGTLQQFYARLNPAHIPIHRIERKALPGRAGLLAMQGAAIYPDGMDDKQ
jgi:peptidoglycan/xylan/chitin deacetylase (PgdA/CDA1 family)